MKKQVEIFSIINEASDIDKNRILRLISARWSAHALRVWDKVLGNEFRTAHSDGRRSRRSEQTFRSSGLKEKRPSSMSRVTV